MIVWKHPILLRRKPKVFIFWSGIPVSLDKLYILDGSSYLGDSMATILIKGLPEDLLKELKRLKVEWNCKTWAELLTKLVESRELVLLTEEELNEARDGVKKFLKLRERVSEKWSGPPSVLEESRRSRAHESS